MQRLTMLVNANGQWVFPGSDEFLEALGDPDPDYDAEAFAVKNQGFIKFSIIERTMIEIELHPRNTTLPALLAIQHQLQSSNVELFRIRYFDSSWHSEITSSAERAMARLRQLASPAFVPPIRRRFIVEPRDYGRLLLEEENPLRLMAQRWRTAFGQFDTSIISFAIEHQFLPRLLIVGVSPRPAEPVWRFIGEAHASWLDAEYRFRAIGERVEAIPDKDYGSWASEFYKHVAGSGEPRYDCITATIQGGPNPYYSKYERLVLPWTTSGDEMLVTVCNRRLFKEPSEASLYGDPESSVAMNSAKSS